MKQKTFSLMALTILSLVMLVGFASAGLDFLNSSDSAITSASASVVQGATASYTFKLQEDGYGNMTGISFTSPILLTSGLNSFNATLTVTNAPTTLNQSNISNLITVTFNVPSTRATGTYNGNL
ncbi:MAG: hypothetical protein KJ721_01550, partial [Nanoarchaeota archaeon]|nr:hypothetical protein [Nanoarchaeota archaeon]